MFGGFDPRGEGMFFERQRRVAITGAAVIYGVSLVVALNARHDEPAVTVALEAEIQDFAVEEPAEPEDEPPLPSSAPPQAKVDVAPPRPKPKIKPPIEAPRAPPPESNEARSAAAPSGGSSPSGSGRTAPPSRRIPAPPVAAPVPVKKASPIPTADPDKPIDRPEHATVPKPRAGNRQPDYPESLRDQGITGEVVMKIHVHRDGSVRGAKILRKRSNAPTDEERALAEKLFVQAAIAAVKTWTFEPAKVEGEAITVWHTVTFPFLLTGG